MADGIFLHLLGNAQTLIALLPVGREQSLIAPSPIEGSLIACLLGSFLQVVGHTEEIALFGGSRAVHIVHLLLQLPDVVVGRFRSERETEQHAEKCECDRYVFAKFHFCRKFLCKDTIKFRIIL